jgi:hypothetical protein
MHFSYDKKAETAAINALNEQVKTLAIEGHRAVETMRACYQPTDVWAGPDETSLYLEKKPGDSDGVVLAVISWNKMIEQAAGMAACMVHVMRRTAEKQEKKLKRDYARIRLELAGY